MKLIFLGTGTSFGVPMMGCGCAVCRSTDPRDKRMRSGAVIETDGGTRLLIDTSPEVRLGLVNNDIQSVDAVLYTHEHADHIHGIDDLRAFTMRRADPLPLYGLEATLATIAARFRYVIDPNFELAPGTTKPNGELVPVTPDVPFQVGDATVVPFLVPHGQTPVVAYRIGPIGYVTDAKRLDAHAREVLEGIEVLVLNALLRAPHPTHLSISEAVRTALDIGAPRTFFTHLTHDNLHAELAAELPPGVSPAYDGLTVHV